MGEADLEDLYNQVWTAYQHEHEQRVDVQEDTYGRLNGENRAGSSDQPSNQLHARLQRPPPTTPSTRSPRAVRPLPPTPGNPAPRPYSADSSSENRRLASAPRAQSVGGYNASTAPTMSRQASQTTSDFPDTRAGASRSTPIDVLDEEEPENDTSSLYPTDGPPLPAYVKDEVPELPPVPSYAASQSIANGDAARLPNPYNTAVTTYANHLPAQDYIESTQTGTPSDPQSSQYTFDISPAQSRSYDQRSLSELSYIDVTPPTRVTPSTNSLRLSMTSTSPSVDPMTLPPPIQRINSFGSSSLSYTRSDSDQLSNVEYDIDTPGPSNINRRPTELLHQIMFGGQSARGVLELHDEVDEEYWDEDEEDESDDRFVNFALLSHLAVQLRDKVPRGTHVKGSIPYPNAFTGKDIVSTIQSQIQRELVENHGGSSSDRRAAVQVARSLQSQLFFYEVEWGGRVLQDGVEDVYMFLDDQEGSSNNGPREALPSGVLTILARCYSPSCGEGPCYAYGCPRKGDSLNKLLPATMEAPPRAGEAWPKTVPPEVLRSLPESEINRQIIINKLVSKEEQYVKDLDIVDSVFVKPLRLANPPVITPAEKLQEFMEEVFGGLSAIRECNRRLLEVMYVRQREQAPIVQRIGDILLDAATEFRLSYPAYVGNHPLAERRMKDELEDNPEFRLFIEECSRQQSSRPSTTLRLDLRHFLNRPSEHLQKYPVLLRAILNETAQGNPDAEYLREAMEAIKNLQGVAQLRTFQSAMGRGATGKWEWQDLVSPELRRGFTSEEAKRQSIIFNLVKGEMVYVRDLENIRTIYIRALRNSDPPIIPRERLDRFIKDVFHNFAELRIHHRRLVDTFHEIQREEHPRIRSVTAAVFDAALNFRDAYLEYIPNYPIAAYRIDEEMGRNSNFKAFVENCVRHPDARRLDMKTFLRSPIPRLLEYELLLKGILDETPRGHEDREAIPQVIDLIKALGREIEPGVQSAKQRVQLWQYSANLVFKPGETMDLDLLNESRSLIHTGKLLRQPESSNDDGGWVELFVLLFDNYLVMTKLNESAGTTRYHVMRRPIPLDLLSIVKFTDQPVQRGSVPRSQRSERPPESSASNASGSQSENGDSRPLYPCVVHHNGRLGGPYVLYAESSSLRVDWKQKLEEALGLRKVVQESNKVFEVDPLSKHTFNVPPPGGSITPWSESSPVTGKVTCSIPFNTPDGRHLVAIGCAEGIWIGFRRDSPSMRRVLHLRNVTQCTMLDDFGLFLVLADKQLFAYHIEALVPTPPHNFTASPTPQKLSGSKEVVFFSVGKIHDRTFVVFMRKKGSDSHFHVLQPVVERIHERPKAPTGVFGLLRSTKARIAILSAKGFDIMDMNDFKSTRIPLPDSRLSSLESRFETCRPIGMFRSREDEFLLCYTEFGVYVNKQGNTSRTAFTIEWEGTADSVAFHAPYVLLFDPRFIEIRHVETGRLAQIIHGVDIRCVWDGRGLSTNTAVTPGATSEEEMVQEAHVHAVMNNPDHAVQQPVGRPPRPISQLVFELIPTIPLYLPGSLSSPSTTTYFPHADSFSPPRSPQLRPVTGPSYLS
ncbi:Rho1 guanine nucleotide exchange factor 2 [Hypsizygus marmoreus]|uniref:Rho1 guanine nucleotide exchange factor 2 n=1 Tax=Hypsizygus marmoreus TaxID=39966 RepID=A0A369JFQ0_HYPMA|nr:Rho1 guanine nucleotide exchange factor 2 [Hypsizygus marmoreus]